MTAATRRILALATRSEARVEAVRAALAVRLLDGLLLRLNAGDSFTPELPGQRKRDTIHVRVEDTSLDFFGRPRPPRRGKQP
jgi:hypothetical protein